VALKKAPVVWAQSAALGAPCDDARLLAIAEELQTCALKERAAESVLHDVNNIMTALLYEVHAARERLRSGDSSEEALGRVHTALVAAAGITRGFALAGDGEGGAHPEVDVRNRVGTLVPVLAAMGGDGVGLYVEVPRGLPRAAIRPTAFDRILLNLVANGVDAIGGRGRVLVSARAVEVARSMFDDRAAPPPGNYLRVTVEDDGRGMPDAVVKCAFEPAYTTKPGGTGIGLAIVARCVHGACGRVGIRSVEQVGTGVDVYLPSYGAETKATTSLRR
jgi:signal transduction histidine kinase